MKHHKRRQKGAKVESGVETLLLLAATPIWYWLAYLLEHLDLCANINTNIIVVIIPIVLIVFIANFKLILVSFSASWHCCIVVNPNSC